MKSKPEKRKSAASLDREGSEENDPISLPAPEFTWSFRARLFGSVLVIGWLIVVVLGPLSNPISSPHFSRPLAEIVAPLHQALFLDHGYRFFAPDPTASHLLIFEGIREDGTEFSGQIPDRKKHSPRLLYHRWFMLSETLFGESFLKPSKPAFEERSKEYDRQLQALIASNEMSLHRRLSSERELEIKLFEKTNQRVEAFTKAIAKVLLERNSGESIELFVRERGIPFPEQVRRGIRLDDESYLSEKLKIGQLNAEGFRLFEMTAIPEEIQ